MGNSLKRFDYCILNDFCTKRKLSLSLNASFKKLHFVSGIGDHLSISSMVITTDSERADRS